ncbi:MAG: site-specific integrase, partial [Planctomycetales bacterium]|nr:site-specific integrase [Planctomycetales bacterium]
MAPAGRRKTRSKAASARSSAQRYVQPWLEYLRTECQVADNTVAAYRRDMARFFSWLGQRDLRKLTIRQLSDYAAWLHQQKLAPSSISRHIVSLKIFFRFLQLEGILRENS